MLVLSRKVNESLVLTVGTKQILIYVTKVEGDGAKIGITAPNDVKVYRKELWDEIMRSNVEALRSVDHPTPLPKVFANDDSTDTVEILPSKELIKKKTPRKRPA